MSSMANHDSFMPAPTSEGVFPHSLGPSSAPLGGMQMTEHLCLSGCKRLGGAAAALTNEPAVDMAFHEFLWFAKYDVEQPIMFYYCWLWNKDLIWISLTLMNVFTPTSKGAVGSSSKLFSSRVFRFWCVPQNRNLSGLMSSVPLLPCYKGKVGAGMDETRWIFPSASYLTVVTNCLLPWGPTGDSVVGTGGRVSSINFQSFKNSPIHKVLL